MYVGKMREKKKERDRNRDRQWYSTEI